MLYIRRITKNDDTKIYRCTNLIVGINTQNHVVCACSIIIIDFILVGFIQPLQLFFISNVPHIGIMPTQTVTLCFMYDLCMSVWLCIDMVLVSAHMFRRHIKGTS